MTEKPIYVPRYVKKLENKMCLMQKSANWTKTTIIIILGDEKYVFWGRLPPSSPAQDTPVTIDCLNSKNVIDNPRKTIMVYAKITGNQILKMI